MNGCPFGNVAGRAIQSSCWPACVVVVARIVRFARWATKYSRSASFPERLRSIASGATPTFGNPSIGSISRLARSEHPEHPTNVTSTANQWLRARAENNRIHLCHAGADIIREAPAWGQGHSR